MSFDLIRMPNSRTIRSSVHYCKLLRSVDPNPRINTALAFHGLFFRPGSTVPLSKLRPGPEWPADPVVIECAGKLETNKPESPYLYLLWRLDGRRWTEIGRAASRGTEWICDLRPMALRLTQPTEPLPPVDLEGPLARIQAVVDEELERLDPGPRRCLVHAVLEQFASHVARLGGSIAPMPR